MTLLQLLLELSANRIGGGYAALPIIWRSGRSHAWLAEHA